MPGNPSDASTELRRGPGPLPDICIVGGAGHVGLPLGITFASKGQRVMLYDINVAALQEIRQGRMPFVEHEAQPLLRRALDRGLLSFTSSPADAVGVPTMIVTIGTPVDEFLNPDTKVITKWVHDFLPHLVDHSLLILRSTVYPGTTDRLDRTLRAVGKNMKVAYCPERIVQGFAVQELQRLPQLVSGTTPAAQEQAAALFSLVAPEVVRMAPLEAEFAKLFCNAYRYIQFATANQFYTMCRAAGVDYHRVLDGMKQGYPRMRDVPRAGFTAGPCLLKDTMQLVAFAENQFSLGHAAMLVNEGLMLYIVNQIQVRFPLEKMSVGLLGMAFKPESDDPRSSLSYKLKKLLQFKAAGVLTTDPYVTSDRDLLSLDEVLERSDLLVLCTPHKVYKDIDVKGKPVADIWGYLNVESVV